MIAKGKAVSHGKEALDYPENKQINGHSVATEICRNELYGLTGAEMVQEMKPYHTEHPTAKNVYLRFEISPSEAESAGMKDEDWKELTEDFIARMGLQDHQYIAIKHSGTEHNERQAHLHLVVNRVSLSCQLYPDNWLGKRAAEVANNMARDRGLTQAKDISKANKTNIKALLDEVLRSLRKWDYEEYKRRLEAKGLQVREARASTGRLNGYYITGPSGTEYKASEIGKVYTLAHLEKTHYKLSKEVERQINISHGTDKEYGGRSI